MDRGIDRRRLWAYAFVAVAGLLVGMALGQLGACREDGTSRVAWPAPKLPQPRSLGP